MGYNSLVKPAVPHASLLIDASQVLPCHWASSCAFAGSATRADNIRTRSAGTTWDGTRVALSSLSTARGSIYTDARSRVTQFKFEKCSLLWVNLSIAQQRADLEEGKMIPRSEVGQGSRCPHFPLRPILSLGCSPMSSLLWSSFSSPPLWAHRKLRAASEQTGNIHRKSLEVSQAQAP